MKRYFIIICALFFTGCTTAIDGYHAGVVHTPHGDYVDSVKTHSPNFSLWALVFGDSLNSMMAPDGYTFGGSYYPAVRMQPYCGIPPVPPSYYYRPYY